MTNVSYLIQVQSPGGEFVAQLVMKVLCLQSASIFRLRLQLLSMPSTGNALSALFVVTQINSWLLQLKDKPLDSSLSADLWCLTLVQKHLKLQYRDMGPMCHIVFLSICQL